MHDECSRVNKKFRIGRVLSIKSTSKGIRFREECDQHLELKVSHKEAKQILYDAISFIEECESELNLTDKE